MYQRKRKHVYDEKALMNAINAVKSKESFREAGMIYGIPKSTLADKLNKTF